MSSTAQATVKIINELGLHARAATVFVQTAARFEAEITVTKDGREANGKSIMGLLTLVAARDSTIRIAASGPDAAEAVAALTQLVADRFGEGR